MNLISVRKPFRVHYNTQDTYTFEFFQVPLGHSKRVENFKFHNDAPILKYFQKSFNSCFFSSLESSFVSIKKTKATNSISLRIEESLKSEVGNHIDFANNILKTKTN